MWSSATRPCRPRSSFGAGLLRSVSDAHFDRQADSFGQGGQFVHAEQVQPPVQQFGQVRLRHSKALRGPSAVFRPNPRPPLGSPAQVPPATAYSQPVPACPSERPRRSQKSELVHRSSARTPVHLAEPARRQFDVASRRLLGLLLERVQHVYGLGQRREVDHPKRPAFITHAKFPHTRADGSYRLPILRIEASLNTFKLIAGLVLRSDGDVPKCLQCITDISDGLHGAVARSELRRSFVSCTTNLARISASIIQRPLARLFRGAR